MDENSKIIAEMASRIYAARITSNLIHVMTDPIEIQFCVKAAAALFEAARGHGAGLEQAFALLRIARDENERLRKALEMIASNWVTEDPRAMARAALEEKPV